MEVDLNVKVESSTDLREEESRQGNFLKRTRGNPLKRKQKKFRLGRRPKKYSCPYCPYKTARDHHLNTHKLIHENEKEFECQYCDYKTHYSRCLVYHEEHQHGNGDPNFVKVRKTHENKKHRCKLCEYRTAHANHLKTHQAIHSTAKPLKCEFCDFTTKYSSALKRHKDKKHSNEVTKKEFVCDQCDYSTSVESELQIHMTTHYDNYFLCNMCDYETIFESMFREHVRAHVLENNDVSANEGEYFDENLSNTVIQSKSKRAITSTPEAVEKQNEVKIMKTLKCPQCDYTTGYKNHYDAHLRKHSDVKEFKCDLCDFETKYKTALSRHIKQHSRENKRAITSTPEAVKKQNEVKIEKTFKCPQCDYTTGYKQHYGIHLKKHSN